MQFLLIAYDGTDEGAAARREATRPAHIMTVTKLKEEAPSASAARSSTRTGRRSARRRCSSSTPAPTSTVISKPTPT